MRLLTIRVNRDRYGAENHMLRIACGAARRGMEVLAAFPRAEGTASMIRDCEAAGVSHLPFEWKPLEAGRGIGRLLPRGRGRSVPCFLQMRNLLRSVRPDVLQMTAGGPDEILVPSISCALSQVPMLAVFQSAVGSTDLPAWRLKALAWARRRRQRWMAVSRQNLVVLEAIFRTRTDEIGILANGIEIVDAPSRMRTEALRREVREELELPAGSKLLLTTARFAPAKGYADLLEIVPKVLEEFRDAVFLWAGDGKMRTALEAVVRQRALQRHVRFLGYRTDIDRLLQASDLFVFPSHLEGGCSSSIREAMVHRVPIVCSDAGGIPEVLSHGTHALIFPAKDTDGMLARLCHALRHPTEMRRFAERARTRIEEFSSERMLENYLAVLRRLCQSD